MRATIRMKTSLMTIGGGLAPKFYGAGDVVEADVGYGWTGELSHAYVDGDTCVRPSEYELVEVLDEDKKELGGTDSA